MPMTPPPSAPHPSAASSPQPSPPSAALAAPAAPALAPGAPPTGAAAPTAQVADAPTAEEQTQYENFVRLAVDMVQNPKNRAVATAVERLLRAPNTKEGVATAAVTLGMRVFDAAAQAGTKLSPVVVQHGLVEVVEELGEFARSRGIKDLDEDELSGAYIGALDLARVELGRRGAVDADDAKAEWAELENNPSLLAGLQERYGGDAESPEAAPR